MWSIDRSVWFSIFTAIAVKSTVVVGAAWVAAMLMRRRSAASRHLVWMAAFAALLTLPLLSVSLPPLHVARTLPLPNVSFQTTAAATAESPDAQDLRIAGVTAAPKQATSRMDLAFWLMMLWMAGVAAVLLQMAAATVAMWRVRRRARALVDADADALAETLGIQQPVPLLEAPNGSMPMTFGLFRPVVFLPAGAAEWSAERRRVVLLHELAHVRRGDVPTHLLARIALSLYWWNPLAWTAWRSFLKERERATDDLVLAAGARASEYAGHLLEIARQMQSSPAMGWAAVAMARPSQLEGRLLAILDTRVNRKAPGRAVAALASLLAVAVVAPLAAVQSQDPAAQALPADVDATIRAANSQKNHQMLETAAQAAASLKQYDVAQKLLESAVAIRQQVSGDRSSEYAAGLIKLGDLEFTRNHQAEAQAFYEKAVGILSSSTEAAPAYLRLGTLAMARRDFQSAIDSFQQAQVADPSKAANAMMWMALANQRRGDLAESESLFRGALALQDGNSSASATTLDLYAQLLRQSGRNDEALEMSGRATQVRKGSRATAPRGDASGVYRVGGGVSAPSLLFKVEPEYSEEARVAKYQGTVTVYAEIGPDGAAHNAQVLQGLGLGLDQKALDAISQWKFKPGTKDGLPVTVAATIEVNFRLL